MPKNARKLKKTKKDSSIERKQQSRNSSQSVQKEEQFSVFDQPVQQIETDIPLHSYEFNPKNLKRSIPASKNELNKKFLKSS